MSLAQAKIGGALRRVPVSAHATAALIVLLAALVLGGGTRPGLPSDFFIRLVSWPVLIAVLPLFFLRSELRQARPYAIGAFGLCLVPILQLVPLPPWLWTALPGRSSIVSALTDAGLPLTWRPMTMQASATAGALGSLAAPVAMFLLVIQLTRNERRFMVLTVIAFGLLSVVFGFLQISQGESSPLRFYAITNASQAVGFFANRNHFAALLYMLIPLVAAWVLATALKVKRSGDDDLDGGAVVSLGLLIGAYAVILLAQGMASSRAGLGLAGLATLASFAMLVPLRHRRTQLRSARYLLAAAVIGAILISNFALVRIFQRTDLDQVDQYRVQFTQETWRAAKSYLPIGSGMGTFVPVYFSIEKPENATSEYVNRAHDDFVETWLEAGVVAPAVVIAFLCWWIYRLARIWRRPLSSGGVTDGLLARAASIAVILPVLHSAFDYPLRTEALMTLFALMIGLLVDPIGRTDPEKLDDPRKPRRKSRRKRKQSPAAKPAAAAQPITAPVA